MRFETSHPCLHIEAQQVLRCKQSGAQYTLILQTLNQWQSFGATEPAPKVPGLLKGTTTRTGAFLSESRLSDSVSNGEFTRCWGLCSPLPLQFLSQPKMNSGTLPKQFSSSLLFRQSIAPSGVLHQLHQNASQVRKAKEKCVSIRWAARCLATIRVQTRLGGKEQPLQNYTHKTQMCKLAPCVHMGVPHPPLKTLLYESVSTAHTQDMFQKKSLR